MFKHKRTDGNVIKGVFLAYFILIFHVVLLGGVGLMVLFLSGIIHYLPWILLGGLGLMAGSGYLLMRYLRKKGGSLIKILNLPEFRGRNIEVSVLGGLASLKINGSESRVQMIGKDPAGAGAETADDDRSAEINDLTRLAGLLEQNLITPDEYQQAKQRLLEQ